MHIMEDIEISKKNKIFNIEKKIKWSQNDDNLLLSLVVDSKRKNWIYISSKLPRKFPLDCYKRYRLIRPFMKKGRWTKEEDSQIEQDISQFGTKWSIIAKKLGDRTGKQIRERYLNRLDKNLKKLPFSFEEDLQILKLQKTHGNSWKLIADSMSGRTGDSVKSRYNSTVKQNKNLLLFIERRDYGVRAEIQKPYL